MMKKILVFAAHPDDEILGAGATIRRLVNEGCEAHAVILGEGLTARANSREAIKPDALEELKNNTYKASKIIGYSTIDFCDLPDNRFDSVDLLEVIKIVLTYVGQYNPDVIFTHHYGDLNIDHQKTYEAVITACRPVNGCTVEEIYCFETPSSTEWNFQYGSKTFCPNVFFDVAHTLDDKLKAMECYLSEGGEFPHPRSIVALSIIAKRWGSVCGKFAAEAFELVRKIV